MKHKIEIAPNLAIYIDGERVIGSKPYGLFLTTVMTVSDDDLKRLADRCLEVISDCKTESSLEKPNNCETCEHYKLTCDLFSEICEYEPKTEPTTEDCDYCKMTHKYWYEHCDTCEHKPKDEPQIYGNEHNCIMTLFGDCSYAETGCGSCEVVEKVRKALDKYKLKDELHIDIHGITDCDFCKHGSEEWDSEACDGCCNANNHFEPKDGRERVMLIIQLIRDYLNGEDMPKRIKYEMMMEGYEYFRWDAESEEYVCETDDKCFLSLVPWHHLRDFVEIVE